LYLIDCGFFLSHFQNLSRQSIRSRNYWRMCSTFLSEMKPTFGWGDFSKRRKKMWPVWILHLLV
jgi:hypothetical protein